MPSRLSGAPLGSAGSADHVVEFLLLVHRWSSCPAQQMNADHKGERRSQRWTQITKVNANHKDERRSNSWTQIKQMNADQTDERRSQRWTQITKMNEDHKVERRSQWWTQIKQMNADQTDERRSNSWTQITKLNADHKDERRSNRWMQITKMNADQTDERRSNRWTQIKLGVADGASDGDELGASEGDNWGCGGAAIHPRSSSLQRGAESEADQDKTRWNQAGCGLWAAGAVDLILQASESASVWAECGGTAHRPCQSIVSFEWEIVSNEIFWWRHDPAPREREGSGRTVDWKGIYRGIYRVRLTFDSVAGSMSCRWKIAS